jgi:hypothetical protein
MMKSSSVSRTSTHGVLPPATPRKSAGRAPTHWRMASRFDKSGGVSLCPRRAKTSTKREEISSLDGGAGIEPRTPQNLTRMNKPDRAATLMQLYGTFRCGKDFTPNA